MAGESIQDRPERPGAAELAALLGSWLREMAPADDAAVRRLVSAVDRGEAEAIVLASEHALRLLIDDRDGRRAAGRLGVEVFGSGGALVLAKRLGLVSLVRPLLDDLMARGLRLSSLLYGQILADAGEPTTDDDHAEIPG